MGAVVSCVRLPPPPWTPPPKSQQSNTLPSQIQSVFRAIGRTIMAIVNAIGNVIMAIVNGVISVISAIVGFLTCNTCGGRRGRAKGHTTGRRGFGRRRHGHTTAAI